MYTPRQIVVPVDFSDSSRAAADQAVCLGEAFEAPVHLLHALRFPIVGTYSESSLPRGAWATVHNQARARLEALEGELAGPGRSLSSELADSDPLPAIEAVVERLSANLVVMGTHGDRGRLDALLGSVAARTLRAIDCPIMVVKESEADTSAPPRRILFATDFSVHSAQAALVALGLASRFGAGVDIVHAFSVPAQLFGPYEIAPTVDLVGPLRDDARSRLDEAVKSFSEADIDVESHLEEGFASEVVSREAERIGADLIVMGTRGNTGLKHVFLGSVAERTLRVAPCPVLTTKQGDVL